MIPDVESHHEPHRTGHRWVDFSVAACALIVSLSSLGVAIHHGHTMERLVAANSLPFLQFVNSNGEVRSDGSIASVISYQLRNAGAGPARIEWFKSSIDDRSFARWREVLGKGEVDARRLTTSDIAPFFLKGGDSQFAMRWEKSDANAASWDAFDDVRAAERIHLQACYCSIFEECWVADSKVFKPKSVPHC